MSKITLIVITPKYGGDYPHPFDLPGAGRKVRNVTRAVGAVGSNANHVILLPGCWL